MCRKGKQTSKYTVGTRFKACIHINYYRKLYLLKYVCKK